MAQQREFDPRLNDVRSLVSVADAGNLSQQIRYFDARYDDAKKLVSAEEWSLRQMVKAGRFSEVENSLEPFSNRSADILSGPARDFMATDAFQAATFSQKMGLSRFRFMSSIDYGYAAVSAIEAAILLERNRQSGVIRIPPVLALSKDRQDGLLGTMAQNYGDGQDISKAISAHEFNQQQVMKDAQTDTIKANNKLARKPIVQAMRILSGSDHCSFCVSHAGYWTIDIDSVSGFHNACRCKIITRSL